MALMVATAHWLVIQNMQARDSLIRRIFKRKFSPMQPLSSLLRAAGLTLWPLFSNASETKEQLTSATPVVQQAEQLEWDEIDDGRIDYAFHEERLAPIHLIAEDRALVNAGWSAFCQRQDEEIRSQMSRR